MRLRLVVLAAGLVALAAPVWAQVPASDYSRAMELRNAGRFREALPLLEAASRSTPDDADVWLNLGIAYSVLRRFDDAERALGRAAQLAPDYPDVAVARARLAFFRNDPRQAQRLLAPVLTANPDDTEARDLSVQVNRAIREAGSRWRLDAGLTYGELTRDLKPTRIQQVALGYTTEGGTAVGSVEHVDQFGREDTYLEALYGNRFGYAALGLTPSADFRPEWAVRLGWSGVAFGRNAGWRTQIGVDGAYASYATGHVRSLNPGLAVSRGEVVTLTGRWINVIDETDEYRTGYALRGTLRPASRLEMSAGYSRAPESSEGRTVRVEAYSAGLAYDVTPNFTLRLDAVREDRRSYDRDLFSVGVTRRF